MIETCHGWLSTNRYKIHQKYFLWEEIHHVMRTARLSRAWDCCLRGCAWITQRQSPGAASRLHNILPVVDQSQPCPNITPPPSLEQLMHHNLNNNYVQYNFWWSKLTKTSLYQQDFCSQPHHSTASHPSKTLLVWVCKFGLILQNVVALKIAHWRILCLLAGAIIKNHHQLLMHIFERLELAKNAIWVSKLL